MESLSIWKILTKTLSVGTHRLFFYSYVTNYNKSFIRYDNNEVIETNMGQLQCYTDSFFYHTEEINQVGIHVEPE